MWSRRIVLRLSRDGDFDFDTRLDVDDDLLHDLSRSVEIDQALVNPR